MRLSGRAVMVVQRALRQGLVDRKVIDTALYDWKGEIQPQVVTQLTPEMILNAKGSGEVTLEKIIIWLAGYGLALKSSSHRPGRAGTDSRTSS